MATLDGDDETTIQGIVEAAVKLIRLRMSGKSDYNMATGVLTVYDDDGTTPLFTMTPTVTAGVRTVTPDLTP